MMTAMDEHAFRNFNVMVKSIVGYCLKYNPVITDLQTNGLLSENKTEDLRSYILDRLGYCIYLMQEDRLDDLRSLTASYQNETDDWQDIELGIGEKELSDIK